MIRFLDLSEAINNDPEDLQFAWYDTIKDEILSFNGENNWTGWNDFEKDFLNNIHRFRKQLPRFKKLFPDKFSKEKDFIQNREGYDNMIDYWKMPDETNDIIPRSDPTESSSLGFEKGKRNETWAEQQQKPYKRTK